jgi:hypothetical protein
MIEVVAVTGTIIVAIAVLSSIQRIRRRRRTKSGDNYTGKMYPHW